MADAADLAQDVIDDRLAKAIAEVPRYQGDSSFYCLQCDDVIPHQRRAALPGVQLCVACASAEESRARHRR